MKLSSRRAPGLALVRSPRDLTAIRAITTFNWDLTTQTLTTLTITEHGVKALASLLNDAILPTCGHGDRGERFWVPFPVSTA